MKLLVRRSWILALMMVVAETVFSQSKPLEEGEKRTVLMQLYELEAARAKIAAFEEWIEREQSLRQREADLAKQLLEAEKMKTELTAKERDLAIEQAQYYKNLYTVVIKKRGGFGCLMGRVFTLGLYRCK